MTTDTHSLAPARKGWPPRFIFSSGHVSLDFAHTGGEGDHRIWERLHQPSDLADWLSISPLRLTDVEVTPDDVQAAYSLREAIWNIAYALAHALPPQPDDIELLNRRAAQPDLIPQLGVSSEKIRRHWGTPVTAQAALATIARDAVDLFSGLSQASRIRECANPQCAILFVDTSRPGQRRWCSMERCGNITKTTRYRRKQSKTADTSKEEVIDDPSL